jgi:hypothetical protein
MILPEKLSLTTALAVGAVALAAYLVSIINGGEVTVPPGTQVASAGGTPLVRSVEGGVQSGGYIDGRPVPSGFSMPVVIRYQPSGEPAAQPPAVGRAGPAASSGQ